MCFILLDELRFFTQLKSVALLTVNINVFQKKLLVTLYCASLLVPKKVFI